MDLAEIAVGAGIVLAVVAFVVWPTIAAGGKHPVGASGATVDDAEIERRVHEYRAALRRRTICARCLHANVAGARFCAECGKRLAADDVGRGSAAA